MQKFFFNFNPHLSLFAVLIVLFSGSAFLNSCSSGKKAYERGDYYTSVIQSIERLRKSPTNKKARANLQKAYPTAVKYYIKRIDDIKKTTNPFKGEQILSCYKNLNALYKELQRCPSCTELIETLYYYPTEETQFSKIAAEERYQAGLDALSKNTRESAKAAIDHFNRANSYSPNYKDIAGKLTEAYELATLKVVVDQLPVPTVTYQLSVEFFQDKIDQYIAGFNQNKFVKFLAPTKENFRIADEIVMLRFDEFQVGNTRSTDRITEVKRDSVIVGTIKLDNGEVKNVYGTVKAKLTEHRTEISSSGLVTMKIINNRTNSVLVHDKFPGEYVWGNIWATFNGDERALSNKQLDMTRKSFTPPPPPQTLFVEFCRPIYDQVCSSIYKFYKSR